MAFVLVDPLVSSPQERMKALLSETITLTFFSEKLYRGVMSEEPTVLCVQLGPSVRARMNVCMSTRLRTLLGTPMSATRCTFIRMHACVCGGAGVCVYYIHYIHGHTPMCRGICYCAYEMNVLGPEGDTFVSQIIMKDIPRDVVALCTQFC